jgi:hypothetical protein
MPSQQELADMRREAEVVRKAMVEAALERKREPTKKPESDKSADEKKRELEKHTVEERRNPTSMKGLVKSTAKRLENPWARSRPRGDLNRSRHESLKKDTNQTPAMKTNLLPVRSSSNTVALTSHQGDKRSVRAKVAGIRETLQQELKDEPQTSCPKASALSPRHFHVGRLLFDHCKRREVVALEPIT